MRRAILLLLTALALGLPVQAHVGSPDLFYNGLIGLYPAKVTIRVPRVIPGRAEISVRLETSAPAEVSFLPLYAKTEAKNAPPPDPGVAVPGEPNLYAGELWLMSFGSYSVEVRVRGAAGDGSVQIPVTSVATRQLPMPSLLGKILAVLGSVLVIGLIGIARGAAREAALAPGEIPGIAERHKGWIAATAASLLLAGTLYGGWHWWKAEEAAFREHLREGAWPDLSAEVDVADGVQILRLRLGGDARNPKKRPVHIPPLIPDHGKLMHLFLIREGGRDAFAHVHPIRREGLTFEVPLPPLPAGKYTIFSDLTYEGGSSSTAQGSVEFPERTDAKNAAAGTPLAGDPDDSWATYPKAEVPHAADPAPAFRTEDGVSITWKAQKPIRAGRDASLKFDLTDKSGKPLLLEPYMGMLSHAAVLRDDGAIFAHLHPTGNYSMAAQSFFEKKLAEEGKLSVPAPAHAGHGTHAPMQPAGHAAMHHSMPHAPASSVSTLELPYEFAEPGNYRIWVQFKHAGLVRTAVFDAQVEP